MTCRPSELAQARHPFLPLKLDLDRARHVPRDRAGLAGSGRGRDRYLALQFPDHAFPRGFARLIHQRTEGHPLFMADLLRDLRRRQMVRQQDGRWMLAEDLLAVERELPESVRSLVQRKIDALDDADRRLLGAASVQGVDFDTGAVAAALQLPEEEVEDRLERLEREHALVRFVDEQESRDRALTLRYRFAHHVYHNAFYESLRATRRAALSRAIAERLVAADRRRRRATARRRLRCCSRPRATTCAPRSTGTARRRRRRGSTRTTRPRGSRSAGSRCSSAEPDSPEKAAAELGLQMTYGLAVKTSRGYAVPEVGAAYARARELCRQVDDPGRVVPVLIGLSAHHIVSGEITTSRDVALEMLELFNRLGDPNLQMMGKWSLGAALFHLGELEVGARASGARARALRSGVPPRARLGDRHRAGHLLPLRVLADADAARLSRSGACRRPRRRSRRRARSIIRSRSRSRCCSRSSRTSPAATRARSSAPTSSWPSCAARTASRRSCSGPRRSRGRALVELGDTKRGLRVLEEGLAAHTITRSALLRPYYFVLLAGALLRVQEHRPARSARSTMPARSATRPSSTPTRPSTRGCRPSCSPRPGGSTDAEQQLRRCA